MYQHLARPDKVAPKTCYHLFQEGIQPLWEDEANKAGGRWHVWFQKGYSNRLWEDILLATIGNQFEYADQITGVEVRTKMKGDTISIWHKNANNEDERESIKRDFLKALNAPEGLTVQYENFSETLNQVHKRPHRGGKGYNRSKYNKGGDE